jgi:hypothetical protein
VTDAALLYDLMQGPDPLDPRTRGIAPSDPTAMLKRGVRGLRLARMPAAERDGVTAEVLAAYDASLDKLAQLGAEIVTVELPRRFADFTSLTGRIIGAEGYFLVGDLVDDMTLPIDDAVRPRIGSGRGVSARDYLRALSERDAAKQEFASTRRCRCVADADHPDRRHSPRQGRPGVDAGAFHALCQRAGTLRPGIAERRPAPSRLAVSATRGAARGGVPLARADGADGCAAGGGGSAGRRLC